MCARCHEEANSPTLWNDSIKRAVDLIHRVYRYHSTGGLLHVVLDDWNIGDEHVQWAEAYVTQEAVRWKAEEPEMVAACQELAPLLAAMTEQERASSLAYADGVLPRPDTVPTDRR